MAKNNSADRLKEQQNERDTRLKDLTANMEARASAREHEFKDPVAKDLNSNYGAEIAKAMSKRYPNIEATLRYTNGYARLYAKPVHYPRADVYIDRRLQMLAEEAADDEAGKHWPTLAVLQAWAIGFIEGNEEVFSLRDEVKRLKSREDRGPMMMPFPAPWFR